MEDLIVNVTPQDGLVFVLVALAITLVMQALKTALQRGDLPWVDDVWFRRYVMPAITLGLGVVASLPAGLLPGGDHSTRMLVGVAAAWAAVWTYQFTKKREPR